MREQEVSLVCTPNMSATRWCPGNVPTATLKHTYTDMYLGDYSGSRRDLTKLGQCDLIVYSAFQGGYPDQVRPCPEALTLGGCDIHCCPTARAEALFRHCMWFSRYIPMVKCMKCMAKLIYISPLCYGSGRVNMGEFYHSIGYRAAKLWNNLNVH